MKTAYLFKQYINKLTGLTTTVKSFSMKDYKVTTSDGSVYENIDFHNTFELKSAVPYYFNW